ncbi:MAG: DUF4974 domain-containing protein [Alphaproteobacteria bacterium]|nr:DUF4974 domain-containing protein [Alphaproteobacteria bacterium]
MTKTPDMVREDRTLDEAASWFRRLTSGHATDEDFAAHAEWLAEDVSHLLAYDRFERLDAELDDASDLVRQRFASDFRREAPSASWLARVVRAARGTGRPGWLVPAAAGVVAVAVALAVVPQLRGLIATPSVEYETARGQFREVQLADGSTVTLDAATDLTVRYSDDRRQVHLKHGSALFDVQHDPARPFAVAGGGRQVTVLGTKFEVSRIGSEFSVAVARGKVAVRSTRAGEANLILAKGEEATYGADEGGPVRDTVDPEMVGSWRHGQLVFDHASLGRVVDRLNRYYAGVKISIADKRTAALPFTGVLKVGDVHATVSDLAALLRLKYDDRGTAILLFADKGARAPR